jgi:hypothetical protein
MATQRNDKDFPQSDADLGGDYARDTHRGGFGDEYAREGEGGSAARGDLYGSTDHDDRDDESTGKASE